MPGLVPVGYIEAIDDDMALAEMAFEEALDLLADRREAQSIYLVQTDGEPGSTDNEKAYREAEAAGGEERHILFALCAARARRIVSEQAALIVALLPDVVRRPFVTGDELEALIVGLGQRGDRPHRS